MRYRVRLDMSFENQADATALMNYAKNLTAKATSLNETEMNAEISYCESEICRHDEGLPCTKLERVEVRAITEVIK